MLDVDTTELHRLSLDEYHRLIEAGAFDEDLRVELIDGLLVEMSPRTEEHEEAVVWLTRWLVLNVDRERFDVRPGCALTLVDQRSEPEPDFAVVARDAPRPYHPGHAVLVVEIAVSSKRRDLRLKAHLYGAAGLPEYWVVDLDEGVVWVHRRPRPGGGYELRTTAGAGDEVRAEALALPPLDVGELLAAARRV